MEDVVQCGAYKTGWTRTAIPGVREPRPGKSFSHRTQERLVNPMVNRSCPQAAKIVVSRHGQSHRQVLPMKNHASSRPAADRRKTSRARANIRIPLGVTERESGSLPSVEAGNRASRTEEQRLVHGHLLRCRPCLIVLPQLQSGYHRLMTYQQRRRNPLLLLVAGGIECLG